MRILCAGYNDLRLLSDGWYGLEKSPEGILYRSSAPNAELHLDTDRRVELSLLLSGRPEHTGEPLRVYVKGEEDAGFYFTLVTNGWTLRQGTVSPGINRIVRIEIQNPWSPDRLYKNGDARSLGVLLSAIRIKRL